MRHRYCARNVAELNRKLTPRGMRWATLLRRTDSNRATVQVGSMGQWAGKSTIGLGGWKLKRGYEVVTYSRLATQEATNGGPQIWPADKAVGIVPRIVGDRTMLDLP